MMIQFFLLLHHLAHREQMLADQCKKKERERGTYQKIELTQLLQRKSQGNPSQKLLLVAECVLSQRRHSCTAQP